MALVLIHTSYCISLRLVYFRSKDLHGYWIWHGYQSINQSSHNQSINRSHNQSIIQSINHQEQRSSWTLSLREKWLRKMQNCKKQMWVHRDDFDDYHEWLSSWFSMITMISLWLLKGAIIRTWTRQLTFWSSLSGNTGPTKQNTITPRISSNWYYHHHHHHYHHHHHHDHQHYWGTSRRCLSPLGEVIP